VITLAQLAKIETDPLRKYVIRNLLREVKLMELIPWETVNSLKSVAVRWRTLPRVGFRKINAGYTPSEGDTEQVWEAVYPLGGEIQYDRVFEMVGNTITDMKRMQTDMKIYSEAVTFNNYLINGDHATDPDGFEGLRKRVSNMPARQTVRFAAAAAAGLDPTASVANGNVFFNALEQLHYSTADSAAKAFLCNEGLKWGIGRVARYIQASGGLFLGATKDTFDRDIPTYKGARVIDVGLLEDQTTDIITDTEAGGTGVLNTTSIYSIAFDINKGIVGIQLRPLEVYDPLKGGEQELTPSKLVRLEWWLGLAGFGSYGIARGLNLEGAPNWT
jgi:hypothetical protein